MASTYYVDSGRGNATTATGADWTNASPSLYDLRYNRSGAAAFVGGDVIYVKNTHAKYYTTNTTINFIASLSSTQVQIISVAESGGVTGDPTAGAVEGTDANTTFQMNGNIAWYGMTFRSYYNSGAGGSGGAADLWFGIATTNGQRFDNCTFDGSYNTATAFNIQVGVMQVRSIFVGCDFRFGNAAQNIDARGFHYFDRCTFGVTGTTPTHVFLHTAQVANITLRSCNIVCSTALVSGSSGELGNVYLENCKVSYTTFSGSVQLYTVEARSASSSTAADETIYDYYLHRNSGVVQDSTSVYKTSSAAFVNGSNTAVPYSLVMTPNSAWYHTSPQVITLIESLTTPWISVWNESTGSKTISMCVAYDGATALKGNEIVLQVEYPGTTSTLQHNQAYNGATTLVNSTFISPDDAGSSLSDDSQTWTGTSGWSNKKTHTLSASVTVDHVGYIRARVALNSAAVTNVYVDPKITIA